jgi:chemotaxis protein methyltransferase CheR
VNPTVANALDRVRSLLATHAGLEPPEWVLNARLRERMSHTGIGSRDEYANLISSPQGGSELGHLVEALRVGETSFFRHQAQMRALRDLVVPRLDRHRDIRAWSAGCATGEEAYTLAMILARGLGRTHNIDVLAWDISNRALKRAEDAVYAESSVQSIPDELRNWAMERAGSRDYRVREHLRAMVTFEHRNLAGPNYPTDLDLICCRNVLIYMTAAAKQRIVERLIRALRPGGFLLVGYAESLSGTTGVAPVRTPDAVIYQRIDPEQPAPRRPLRRRAQPGQEIITAISETMPVVVEQATIELKGDYAETDRLSQQITAALRGPFLRVVVDLDGAEFLSDDAAVVLRRARAAAQSSNLEFDIVAQRPGHRRWLRRHALIGEDDR